MNRSLFTATFRSTSAFRHERFCAELDLDDRQEPLADQLSDPAYGREQRSPARSAA